MQTSIFLAMHWALVLVASGRALGSVAGLLAGHAKQSMTFKELFTIVMALSTWGSFWQGKKIRFLCDDKVARQMLQFHTGHAWLPFCTHSTTCQRSTAVLFLPAICQGSLIQLQMHCPGVD